MPERLTQEVFACKATKVHGRKYNYDRVEYVNTKTKVEILCVKHGLFHQTPTRHLSGQGCPGCAGMNLSMGDKLRENTDRHGVKMPHMDTQCYRWLGYRVGPGYGQFMVNKKSYMAHRAAWEVCSGPIPDGMNVCHHCDNPECTKIEHLFLGTTDDNMQDKVRKGRSHGAHPGESHHNAKLTWGDAREIRELSAMGISSAALAEKFGVTYSVVRGIIRGRSWKE